MSELQQHEKSENTQIKAIIWVIGIIIIGIGWAFVVANGANEKSQSALDKTADMGGDIKSINTSIIGINKNLDNINNYFKLTPKDVIQKQINLNGK